MYRKNLKDIQNNNEKLTYEKSMTQKLQMFFSQYWITLQTITGKSFAELLMSRLVISKLSNLMGIAKHII